MDAAMEIGSGAIDTVSDVTISGVKAPWRRHLLRALVRGAAGSARSADDDAVKRGESVFNAADCVGCHTTSRRRQAPTPADGRWRRRSAPSSRPTSRPDKQHGIGAGRSCISRARCARHRA